MAGAEAPDGAGVGEQADRVLAHHRGDGGVEVEADLEGDELLLVIEGLGDGADERVLAGQAVALAGDEDAAAVEQAVGGLVAGMLGVEPDLGGLLEAFGGDAFRADEGAQFRFVIGDEAGRVAPAEDQGGVGGGAADGGLPVNVHLGGVAAGGDDAGGAVGEFEAEGAGAGMVAERAGRGLAAIEHQAQAALLDFLEAGLRREHELARRGGQAREDGVHNFGAGFVAVMEGVEGAVAGLEEGQHGAHAGDPLVQPVGYRAVRAGQGVGKRLQVDQGGEDMRRAAGDVAAIGQNLGGAFGFEPLERVAEAGAGAQAEGARDKHDGAEPA